MNQIASTNLIATLWPPAPNYQLAILRSVILVVGGVALLSLSSQFKIPFYPVPVTLQTFVVLVLGMTYGFRHAISTVVAYLACGAVGLPVFATGAGLTYMVGPTGGYLVGFVLAMALMGFLGDRGWGQTIKSMVIPMVIGTVIILTCGVLWLTNLIGWEKALAGGLYPFIFGEIAKIIVAIFFLPSAWRLVKTIKGK